MRVRVLAAQVLAAEFPSSAPTCKYSALAAGDKKDPLGLTDFQAMFKFYERHCFKAGHLVSSSGH